MKPGKNLNIPRDGQWLWRSDTRSQWDRVDRFIQDKKFYATLPHKLDQAEEEWLESQPETESPWEIEETGTFGEGDWSIRATFKPRYDND